MAKWFRRSAVVLATMAMSMSGSMAQAVLDPPFGLRWGDSPEKLIEWARKHTLDVTIKLPGKQPGLRILEIAPQRGFLPESKASAVEGRFLGGRLYEISVHYSDPTASSDTAESRFENLKRQITAEYGKLRSNQHQRSVKDQFVTRTQSFHREPVKGLFLLLAYTEMEDLLRKSKAARFSLMYRNDNFRKDLEASIAEP